MQDIEKLVGMMKADGIDVTPAEAEQIALNNADSVAAYIELCESRQPPEFDVDPASVPDKFKQPTVMEVL
jgi:hypothetical protein